MARAWIITKDLIADKSEPEGTYLNAVGLTGPSDAPEMLISILKRGGGYAFIMRDDDGIAYYRGRCTWDIDTDDETGAYGPLGDFGMPNAGAVSITYPRHPEYNCG